MTPTQEKIIKIIAKELGIPEHEINFNTSFSDIDYDSLLKTIIVMEVEKEFDIEISEDEINTVGELMDCVDKKMM